MTRYPVSLRKHGWGHAPGLRAATRNQNGHGRRCRDSGEEKGNGAYEGEVFGEAEVKVGWGEAMPVQCPCLRRGLGLLPCAGARNKLVVVPIICR